jgi:HEAT repeat protein
MHRSLKTVALLAALAAIACGSPVENATSTLIEQVRLGDPLAQTTYAENKDLIESEEAVPIWIAELQGAEDIQVRVWSAQILGSIGNDDAMPALVGAMSDVRDVREAAIDAIRRFPDDVAVRGFIDALQSDSRDAQSAALGQLARLGDVQASDAVAEVARGDNPLVADTAVNTLGDLGGANAAAALAALVVDPAVPMERRAHALSNLGRIGGELAQAQMETIITELEGQEDASELLETARQMR